MVVAAPLYYSSGSKAKISEGSDTKAIEQMRCGVMKWWCVERLEFHNKLTNSYSSQ
jgi:hypothetical protein